MLENEASKNPEKMAATGQGSDRNEKAVISNPLAYYAELGFRVFPSHFEASPGCSCKKGKSCEKPGKHPAIKGFQHLASSEFETLSTDRNLFGGKFQNYDIGALTGLEWFVVDSDRGEVEGLPKTWKSKSANRGFHYFFRVPPGSSVRNVRTIMPGVDIKGRGGIVILPSEVNKREWVIAPHETELAECPVWLLEEIQSREQVRNTIHSEVFGRFNLASEVIAEGARNETLFRYACYLRSLSLERDAISSQLSLINETRCAPPLKHYELEGIVSSAYKYPINDDLTNILDLFRKTLGSIQWKGKAGKSDRSILVALLTQNEERYEVLPEGLEVSISYRKLAECTGLTKKTIYTRTSQAPFLMKGKSPNGKKSGTLVILHSLLECVPTTTLTNSNGGGMASVVVTTHSLLFNSMRWGTLGKSAVLILEVLYEGPLRRKDLEERLGYSQGGANGTLKILKDNDLIRSDSGVYSLADDFEEKIQPFLEVNRASIERMKQVHNDDRADYAIRLEARRRAQQDEAEIQRTAEEVQGVYYLLTMDPEAIHNRVKLTMEHHYYQLKFGRDELEREEVQQVEVSV